MADKVVLAYSGGLDTSVAIKWLQEKYNLEVIAFSVDVGNEPDFPAIREKAIHLGAIKALVKDAREVFVKQYVFRFYRQMPPMKGNIRWQRHWRAR